MTQVAVESPARWAEVCSAAFVPLTVSSAAEGFRASLRQRRLSDAVALTRVASGKSQVIRDRRIIGAHPRDNVLIAFHRKGGGAVAQGGRSVSLKSGMATMYDTSTPYILDFPGEMSEVILQLPRHVLPKTGHAFADLVARPLVAGAELTALGTLALAASAPYEQTEEIEPEALADALIRLTRGMLADADVLPLEGPTLLLAMRTYIADNLAEPGLDPERVASAHHVSLRYAQKIFERDDDSLAACIRRVRLDNAMRLLRAGARVYEAAYQSGFDDLDSFTRAFKRQHGVTPSASRALIA